jgi:hypothetical protein
MYSGRQSFYLRISVDRWEGGWWEVKEVSKTSRNSFQSLCLGWSICGFCWLAFQEKVPSFLGTPKNCNNPLNLQGWSYKGRLWFFVRILEQSLEEVDVLSSCFFVLSSRAIVSGKLDCDLCGLKDLHYRM